LILQLRLHDTSSGNSDGEVNVFKMRSIAVNIAKETKCNCRNHLSALQMPEAVSFNKNDYL
jgi:hypothetical protein